MHFAIFEFANIVATVLPLENAKAVVAFVLPLTVEARPVRPQVRALAFFLTIHEVSKILCSVGKRLKALAVLLAEAPKASVDGPFS